MWRPIRPRRRRRRPRRRPAVARLALRTSRSASASPSRPGWCRRRVSRSRTGTCGAMSPTASAIHLTAASGLEQVSDAAGADLADQPAEQPLALARLEVVGGQLRDRLAELGVAAARPGAPASVLAACPVRASCGLGLRRDRGVRLARGPVGVAHLCPSSLVSSLDESSRSWPRPQVEVGGGDPVGPPPWFHRSPVRHIPGRSDRRCARKRAGCGGGQGNSARSGTRPAASAAP